jgi:hypothetical protein
MWTLTSPTVGARSVGIVHLRAESHGICFVFVLDGDILTQNWSEVNLSTDGSGALSDAAQMICPSS